MTNSELQAIANRLRLDVVETVHLVGDGHPGPCMSIADLIAVLFFERMNIRPEMPNWQERDRFILSKGHACPILYAALARKGYFPLEDLQYLRMLDGMLQGHPDMNKTPGIDTVSGSLGNGVGIGTGMALGLRFQKIDSYVYVVVGDGEMDEGIIWESAMAAAKYNLGRLIVFGDMNNNQSGGHCTDLTSLYPAEDKWEAFHWHVQSIDGHDFDAINKAIDLAQAEKDRPSFIAMKTVKGKNISYMENNNQWHKRTPTAEEVAIARRELLGVDA